MNDKCNYYDTKSLNNILQQNTGLSKKMDGI
jgi:hypothetical protein